MRFVIIPYIGPLIASVLCHLTMMSGLGSDFQSEILPTTIYVLIGFWIIQIIDNNLSQPIIFPKCFTSLGNIPCDFDCWLPFGILGNDRCCSFLYYYKVMGKILSRT
jgi:hypothetical protein